MPEQRPCASCGEMFTPLRANHRFDSDTCRVNAQRGKLQPVAEDAAGAAPKATPPLSETVVDRVRRDLEAAGRLDTWLGQSALAMAAVLAKGVGTPSGLSAANRELRETMTAALRGAGAPGSTVAAHRDEVAARRARRGA